MRLLQLRSIAGRIEGMEWLDPPAEQLAGLASKAIRRGALKDLLSGTWLGHPAHPMLTDIPIGAWLSSMFLDHFGGERSERAADALLGLGILAAVPTAASGISDWSDLEGRARRVGLVHAAGNVTGLSLFTLSYLARRSDRRGLGRFLSLLATTGALGSAYLGGHLSLAQGAGVNQNAFEVAPKKWKRAIEESDLPEGERVRVRVGAADVLLYRASDGLFAIGDRCSHRGCSLKQAGSVDGDGVITCGCHGSAFRLSDGSIVRGPATSPMPSYEVRINEGWVEIRVRRERDGLAPAS